MGEGVRKQDQSKMEKEVGGTSGRSESKEKRGDGEPEEGGEATENHNEKNKRTKKEGVTIERHEHIGNTRGKRGGSGETDIKVGSLCGKESVNLRDPGDWKITLKRSGCACAVRRT